MRILIAEDDPVTRRLLEAKLARWGYEVEVTGDGNEAWQALQAENPPQLAILDWMMPGMDGIEICRKARRELKDFYTYIILLTAQHQDEDLVTGMDAGADDYITKPFKSNELRVRLRAGRRIIELQDELIAAREALREKATHDHLTGLWNHGEILHILGQELNRAEREGVSVSVVMADLDHFKNVNDTYGHQTGDAVLRTAAKRLVAATRDYDAVGRYGGEEFLLVLPGCDSRCATSSAVRFLNCIGLEPVDTLEGMIPITVSLGIAASSPKQRLDQNAMVRAADAALYRAKANGRNRFEVSAEST